MSTTEGNTGDNVMAGNNNNAGTSFTPTDEQPILLTAKAVEAVKKAIAEEGEEGDGIRVSVVGGGCAGYKYGMDFEDEPRDDDIRLEFDGVTVYIDPVSANFLRGTVIDYVSGLSGQGFKFINPNAKRTCGCGHSFT